MLTYEERKQVESLIQKMGYQVIVKPPSQFIVTQAEMDLLCDYFRGESYYTKYVKADEEAIECPLFMDIPVVVGG